MKRAVQARKLPYQGSQHAIVTISFGDGAVVPAPAGDSGSLVSTADAALYKARKRGRNRTENAEMALPCRGGTDVS